MDFKGVLAEAGEVLDWFTNGPVSLHRDAHDQEGLEDQEKILERVPEEGHHHDIGLVFEAHFKPLHVDQHDYDKKNVDDCESEETLVEGGNLLGGCEEDAGGEISEDAEGPDGW